MYESSFLMVKKLGAWLTALKSETENCFDVSVGRNRLGEEVTEKVVGTLSRMRRRLESRTRPHDLRDLRSAFLRSGGELEQIRSTWNVSVQTTEKYLDEARLCEL